MTDLTYGRYEMKRRKEVILHTAQTLFLKNRLEKMEIFNFDMDVENLPSTPIREAGEYYVARYDVFVPVYKD